MTSIESPESSSPIVTRSVAAGLASRYCENYEFPAWQKGLLDFMGMFPQELARFVISRFQSISGLPPSVLDDFSIDRLIEERLKDYAALPGPFPVITLGAALGGATAYLSLALDGPFLPQAYVVSLKGGALDGDIHEYLHRSLDTALRLATADPRILTIQHYDPVHDNWLTRFVNHIRFKLLDLPTAYKEFIRSKLQPGGALVYLEGGAQWLRYRVGPRSVFQVGGWGGITPEEFIEGSDRLREFALRHGGLKHTDWHLDGYPLERGPESEWGSEPGLDEAMEAFALAEGYHFIRIHLPHPDDFSRLAFFAARKMIEKDGHEPAGVLVEMFTQYDPTAALQGSLLPLWLIFNTADSRIHLESMLAEFPKGKPVFFSPLSTFSLTPDMVPWEGWSEALRSVDWINIGSRASHFPSDSRALVRWAEPLRAWVQEHRQPVISRLTGEELLELARTLG